MMKKMAMTIALGLCVVSIGATSDASAAGRRLLLLGHGHHHYNGANFGGGRFGGRRFSGNGGAIGGAGLAIGAGLLIGGLINNAYQNENHAGSCNWLRVKAQRTGAPYWWHRYDVCRHS